MNKIVQKLQEPSTLRGLALLMVVAGVAPLESVDALTMAGGALMGLVEIVRREK